MQLSISVCYKLGSQVFTNFQYAIKVYLSPSASNISTFRKANLTNLTRSVTSTRQPIRWHRMQGPIMFRSTSPVSKGKLQHYVKYIGLDCFTKLLHSCPGSSHTAVSQSNRHTVQLQDLAIPLPLSDLKARLPIPTACTAAITTTTADFWQDSAHTVM